MTVIAQTQYISSESQRGLEIGSKTAFPPPPPPAKKKKRPDAGLLVLEIFTT
jgi:hypothetical protein